jgi:hypothetical protein
VTRIRAGRGASSGIPPVKLQPLLRSKREKRARVRETPAIFRHVRGGGGEIAVKLPVPLSE